MNRIFWEKKTHVNILLHIYSFLILGVACATRYTLYIYARARTRTHAHTYARARGRAHMIALRRAQERSCTHVNPYVHCVLTRTCNNSFVRQKAPIADITGCFCATWSPSTHETPYAPDLTKMKTNRDDMWFVTDVLWPLTSCCGLSFDVSGVILLVNKCYERVTFRQVK